jgi:serine protease Do
MTSRISSRHVRSALGPVLAVIVSLCLTGVGAGQGKDREPRGSVRRDSNAVLSAFRTVVDLPSQSTVRVRCDNKDVSLGTIVASDGWIVTKASELKDKITCKLKDGRELDAKLVGVHEPFDLAMLKIDAKGLKPILWADSKTAEVGNWVATPGLAEEPLSIGVVSVATRKVTVRDLPPKSNKSGYLGVALDQIDHGVKIANVMPDSAAAKAGIKVGDVVVTVDGKAIPDPETMMSTIQGFKVGDVVTVKVKRDDKELELKCTLGKRPANDRADFQNQVGNELSSRRGGFPLILQHDTILKPNECGGPLVDLDGKTVGINIARAGRVETYAVPAEAVQTLLVDLKSGKLAPVVDTEAKSKAAMEKLNAAKAELKAAETELEKAKKRLEAARSEVEKAEAEAKKEK